MYEPITTSEAIEAAFAKASPSEREHILAFTKANTEPPLVSKPYGVWTLVYYRNHDTGKRKLGAAIGLEGEGISANRFRAAIGLPAILTRKPVKGKKR